ncbi:MAG: hypothetical protein N2171_03865 [Clostridia bacterium]|nr:hypothetical protein [Clostridia bacterium]
MSETNQQIKERLKFQLDGDEKDQEYALKTLCGLEPLDDWDKLEEKQD